MAERPPYKGKVTVFYHFYKPDDVVSAVHFADLCEGLVNRNWDVTMLTSNRYCRYEGSIPEKEQTINGVKVLRRWRPALNQASNPLRMINSLWIQVAWLWKVSRMPAPDYFVVGTDPQFVQFMLRPLKWLKPKSKVVFWSFDMYPEAIQAEVKNKGVLMLANGLARLMPWMYRTVDLMVDIGPAMRDLLRKYRHRAVERTLVPWALVEPPQGKPVNQKVREAMFGEGAKMGLLYSGNMGMAHDYEQFLGLARILREKESGIVLAFSSRGNRIDEMKAALTPQDTNVKILPFASQEELEDRLNAADIHLLSLRDNWSGIVVPSKFFGSLAAGKPVIYAGARQSCIGRWIDQHDLGLILEPGNLEAMATQLIRYSQHPEDLDGWKQNAFNTYHEKFSKQRVLEGWDELLSENQEH